MKKLFTFIILTLSLLGLGLTSIASESPDTLVVHYFRYDDNYTDFNMWVWQSEPTSLGGIKHDFNSQQKDAHGYTEAYIDQVSVAQGPLNPCPTASTKILTQNRANRAREREDKCKAHRYQPANHRVTCHITTSKYR